MGDPLAGCHKSISGTSVHSNHTKNPSQVRIFRLLRAHLNFTFSSLSTHTTKHTTTPHNCKMTERFKTTHADETGETGGTAPKGKTQAGSPVAVSEVADKDAESKATTEEPASEQVETQAPTTKDLGSEVVKVRGPDEPLSSSMCAPKAPKPEVGPKPTAVVFRPQHVTQEQYQRPPIPDEGHRQLAWVTVFGHEEYVRPVCGYFEVLFPREVPFDRFVSGPGGIALKRINEEVIPSQLVITWVDSVPHRVDCKVPNSKEFQEEPWPERLVVGFSDRMSPAAVALLPNQRLLHDLWEDVCDWACAAWQGYPDTLERFLARRTKERMALLFSMRSVGPDGPLHKAYAAAQ